MVLENVCRWFELISQVSSTLWPDINCRNYQSTDSGSNGPSVAQEPSSDQDLRIRPVRSNQRAPVPVYQTGLTRNRSKPVGFKFEFKSPSATGFDRFTNRFDQFTGQYDRFTGRFDRFTKWALIGRLIFFSFLI